MQGICFKPTVSPVSRVENCFYLVPPLSLGPGYIRVHFDLYLYSFAMFFCQSYHARVKMNAPSLVFAKKRPKKKGKCFKLQSFIDDLYFRNVLKGFAIKICLDTSCFGRKIIVSIMHVD